MLLLTFSAPRRTLVARACGAGQFGRGRRRAWPGSRRRAHFAAARLDGDVRAATAPGISAAPPLPRSTRLAPRRSRRRPSPGSRLRSLPARLPPLWLLTGGGLALGLLALALTTSPNLTSARRRVFLPARGGGRGGVERRSGAPAGA